ncbi:hypothetical protein PR048_018204 [Dryococelus australis]|uniref:alkaline phosphatase n=1 Tax=Dryococelus australis TaxID=614101 RepID=A0ABQ9HBP9_9NEOP|nr:hypothetical protein PR048_018204 [Dryococelus australis]
MGVCVAGQQLWHESARRELERRVGVTPPTERARNVVLVVGDGLGLPTLAATRLLRGQKEGNLGEDTWLAWDRFPALALAKVSTAHFSYVTPTERAHSLMLVVGDSLGMPTLTTARLLSGQKEGHLGDDITASSHYLIPTKRSRNIVLEVGDDLGLYTLATARLLPGQKEGHLGDDMLVAWDHFSTLVFSKEGYLSEDMWLAWDCCPLFTLANVSTAPFPNVILPEGSQCDAGGGVTAWDCPHSPLLGYYRDKRVTWAMTCQYYSSYVMPIEKARNVVLVVGVGHALPTLAIARLLPGQLGHLGDDMWLAWDPFPYSRSLRLWDYPHSTLLDYCRDRRRVTWAMKCTLPGTAPPLALSNVSTASFPIAMLTERARNVVLVVGVGLGPPTLGTTRLLPGEEGHMGEDTWLAWDRFPALALANVITAPFPYVTQTEKAHYLMLVGDGLGLPTLATARLLPGQKECHLGDDMFLPWDCFLTLVILNVSNAPFPYVMSTKRARTKMLVVGDCLVLPILAADGLLRRQKDCYLGNVMWLAWNHFPALVLSKVSTAFFRYEMLTERVAIECRWWGFAWDSPRSQLLV